MSASVVQVTASLIEVLLLQVSEGEVEEMFDFADKDKDGKISYQVTFTCTSWEHVNILFPGVSDPLCEEHHGVQGRA